jgi:hypothetical protein
MDKTSLIQFVIINPYDASFRMKLLVHELDGVSFKSDTVI